MDVTGKKKSALILAGGLSQRMGRDKALLDFNGMPLIEHVVRRVAPLVDELILSGNGPDRFEFLISRLSLPLKLVPDRHADGGPLAGIASGLAAASHDLVLVLAVDMPSVEPELLAYMASVAAGFDAVVPLMPEPRTSVPLPEPLHAFYRRSCLPSIIAHLDAGHHRVTSFLPDVLVRWVSSEEVARFDPQFSSFRNLNTPADWESAVSYFKRQSSGG